MHDVFISYKSEDSAVALRVRDTLEENGIKCWIAERDIGAGSNYAADIPTAIAQCKVFVLIFTQHAQESPWIMKELDGAIAARKLILPLKIGYFDINKTMSFLLTGVQYYDATINPDETMKALVHRIRQAIATNEAGQHRKTQRIEVHRSSGCLPVLLITIALLAAIHYSGVMDEVPLYQESVAFLGELLRFVVDIFRELITDLKAG